MKPRTRLTDKRNAGLVMGGHRDKTRSNTHQVYEGEWPVLQIDLDRIAVDGSRSCSGIVILQQIIRQPGFSRYRAFNCTSNSKKTCYRSVSMLRLQLTLFNRVRNRHAA
jgi:hypothetical protein